MIDPTSVLAVALGAVGAALFLVSRRHAERVARLEQDLESAETRNRQIENDARRFREEAAAVEARLRDEAAALEQRLRDDAAALERRLREREDALTRTEAERDAHDRSRKELEARITAIHAEKLALEAARTRLAESVSGLERRLSDLGGEKDDLERRTRGFQGEWDRQISTLEEEIQTVVRQLGEFRKGTRLPLPPRD